MRFIFSAHQKLQELLKREAIERGYPKQDIEALRLSPTLDSQGKIVDLQFSIPLWLSPNSNRYEALLNAIVSNKLVNLKIDFVIKLILNKFLYSEKVFCVSRDHISADLPCTQCNQRIILHSCQSQHKT